MTSSTPSVERLYGRYRVLERIGVGGMSIVYRARDDRLKRDVAVKVIADHLAGDPRFVRRFHREAQLCARLAHPNIVAVLDAGYAPRDFIVMDLVEGIEAGSLVQDRPRLASDEALHVLLQVADALSHAHDRGVLHEDVSLRNILVTPAWDAKLIDFGLASSAAEAGVAPGLSGTPGYVAPEVVRGGEPSPQSDLYSLGMVAYRLLAGASVARADAVPAAVQRAVAPDPDRRQRSVAEFRAELVMQPVARRPASHAAPPTRTSSARAA